MSKLMGKWIYEDDCLITSCRNISYSIDKFKHKDKLLYVPCVCPKCGLALFAPNTDDLKLVAMTDDKNAIENTSNIV